MWNSPGCDGALIALEESKSERYEQALLKLGVPAYKVPFFKNWVCRWQRTVSHGVGGDSPQAFARRLESEQFPEWQCRQAFQAVKIWLALEQGAAIPEREPLPDRWPMVLERMKRSLVSKHYSPRTVTAYLEWVERLAEFSPQVPRDDREASRKVQEYLEHLVVVKNLSPSSVALARNAFAWLVRKEWGFDLVLEEKGQSHHSRKLPTVLSRQTVRSILDACVPPWDLLFGLQYGCGLRLAELLELRVQDLDLERRVVTVRSGKGDKDRQVPMPESLLPRLEAHLVERRMLWESDLENGWAKVDLPHGLARKNPKDETSFAWQHVFGAPRPLRHPQTGERRRWHPMEKLVRDALHRFATEAGVTVRVHPHLLRHCFATHLVEAGVTLAQVQELMGHARLTTTLVYLHVRSPIGVVRSPLDFLQDQ